MYSIEKTNLFVKLNCICLRLGKLFLGSAFIKLIFRMIHRVKYSISVGNNMQVFKAKFRKHKMIKTKFLEEHVFLTSVLFR